MSTQVTNDQRWIRIGALADIPSRGARKVATPIGDVALFKTGEGEVFALRDRCPHRGGPLSQGMVCGKHVVCPLHEWRIDLASGEAVAPDCGHVAHFAVRIDGDTVWLALPMEAVA